ncbi:MAG TPA: peptidase U32 family protein [Spirochaetota bacterium]|nr:MAG: putative protease YhbU precursor [Spirochaetes bacterium ADurb.Bin133]HNZ27971.1 peptidase U32 family protein [Spirochaetota bacterium]
MKKPELLAPAGDMEKLKVAYHFGADAVYIGMKNFSLRANTKNFDEDELFKAVDYSHKLGKKIYIALNAYVTDDDAEEVIKSLNLINTLKPDGVIISDLGVLYLAKRYAPDTAIHISTQANITNLYSVKQYSLLGARRAIMARELTLDQIAYIAKNCDIEIETFIHGAMCISYSGRCLLSSYMTNKNLGRRPDDVKTETRSANRGDCVHPCRWEYVLRENGRPNQEYPIEQDEMGSYILSSKDICMINHIDKLIESGITGFKIEGRMKSILYLSSIIRAYRRAIDSYFDKNLAYDKEQIDYELNIVSHREFSTGFFFDSPRVKSNQTGNTEYKRDTRLAALIENVEGDKANLKVYNKMTSDAEYEYIGPDMKTVKLGKIILFDKDGNTVETVNHTDQAAALIYDKSGNIVKPEILNILRMKADF